MSTVVAFDDTWRILTNQPLQSTAVADPTGFSAPSPDDPLPTTITDTFTRANSITSLGNADTGEAWVAVGATWGISSNKAYLPSPVNHVAAYLDGRTADGVFECDLLYEDAGDGIMFRAVGAAVDDGFLVYLDNTHINVLVPGFGAHVAGSPIASAHTPGSTYTLKVELSGTSIKVYENGVLKLTTTNSTNLTATYVGLRSGGTTAAKRWDNLSWVPTTGTWVSAPGAFASLGASNPGTVPFTYVFSYGAVTYQTPIGIDCEAYYRKHVPHIGGTITIRGFIDNWVWVFVNGVLVGSDFFNGGGEFTYTTTLPLTDNVIAVRSRSTGDNPNGGHIFSLVAIGPDEWHVGAAVSGGGWA